MAGALTAITAHGATTPDVDALIARLARPAPATVAFTEVRFSPLLKQPLIVSGELGYAGATHLDRRVLTPYREQTAIRGDSVRVEREGEPARSFALKRAPELRGLLNGFTALLAGDAVAIRRNFDAAVTGAEDGWRLELTPTDARARRRLKRIIVSGAADEPRCFSMLNADGGASVMLLGETAETKPAPDVTLEALQERCEPGLGARGAGRGSDQGRGAGGAGRGSEKDSI
ncbi:MAG: LolA-related protein, partial [Steroidobacter sp.]